MSRTTYTAEFKAKVVVEIIQGDEELGAIASKYSINPNMLRSQIEFLENDGRVLAERRMARRKTASN